MIRIFLLLSCLPWLLMACAQQGISPQTHATQHNDVFSSARYGITLPYPADLQLRHSFPTQYLANDDWKTYAQPDGPSGQALMALVLPGSNEVTDGELRIGVSRNPQAVAQCTALPTAARPGSQSSTDIDGVTFTTYKAGDAAMSHYLAVRSFRGVHDATCYAIDVLVFGTNPEVYDPPRTPPFSKQAVFERLVPVVHKLRFTSPSAMIDAPATYTGVLPCADCPGIEYRLTLLPHHKYKLTLDYQDRDAQFATGGHWFAFKGDDGARLLLHENNGTGQPRQWAIDDNGRTLTLLSMSGERAASGLNYSIHRQ